MECILYNMLGLHANKVQRLCTFIDDSCCLFSTAQLEVVHERCPQRMTYFCPPLSYSHLALPSSYADFTLQCQINCVCRTTAV